MHIKLNQNVTTISTVGRVALAKADYMCDITVDVGSSPPPAHVLIY